MPTETLDPDYYYADDLTFSFIPPEDWEPLDIGLEYPALFGPTIDEFNLNLIMVEEQPGFPMAFYTALVQDNYVSIFPDLTTISEEFLFTNEGKDYFRWEVTLTQEGVKIRQIFYFFESGDWTLMIAYTRPADQGSEFDAQVDEAMLTVRFTR